VSPDNKQKHSDHCCNCGYQLEIAAVKFSLFRQPALLFVCLGCALVKTDGCGEAPILIYQRLRSTLMPSLGENGKVRRNSNRSLRGSTGTRPTEG
jgi:hypothetical protein